MASLPGYGVSHLVVAAIRVLEAREEHPPSDVEIARLLDKPAEHVNVYLRGLVEAKVLRTVETAFENRYEIVDHLALEELPREEDDRGMAGDLEEFDRRQQEEQSRLEKLFLEGEAEKNRKNRVQNLDEEFGKFKKGKPANPFGDD